MTDRQSDDDRNIATFAALSVVLLISVSLFALIALVLPGVLWMLLVALALGLFVVLHYVVWGRWLTRALHDQQAADEAFSDSKKPRNAGTSGPNAD